jgi:hypothetical protein
VDGTWEAFGGGLVGLTPSFPAQGFVVDVRGGDVVVAGEFEEAIDANGSTRLANGIIRWDDAAGAWQPLGQGLENDAPVFPRHRDLVYVADGSIYLAGDASDGTGTPIPLEARNPNGSSVFGNVLRWTGTEWQAVDAGLNADVMGDLVRDGSGRFFARYARGGTSVISERDGGAWTTIATFSPFQFASTLAANPFSAQPDVYAGGSFATITDPDVAPADIRTNATTQVANHARWNGTGWQALLSSLTPPAGTNGEVRALAHQQPPGSVVAAGGTFTSTGGNSANNIAIRATETSSWDPVGGGVTSSGATVEALAFSLDGVDLYVGGDFTEVTQTDGTPVPVNHFARYDRDADTWSSLVASFDGPVYALHIVEGVLNAPDVLYIGGAFTQVSFPNGTTLPAPGLIRYRIQQDFWETVGGVSGGVVYALDSGDALPGDASGTQPEFHDLFVGGDFGAAVDRSGAVVPNTTHVARYDAWRDTWHPVGRGANDTVRALAYIRSRTPPNRGPARPEGVLYAGGAFTNVRDGSGANTVVNHLAKWRSNTDSWDVLGFNNAENGTNGPVNVLYEHPGLTDRTYFVNRVGLIVGGDFTEATSSTRQRVTVNRLALLVDEGASFESAVLPYHERFLPFGSGLDGPVDAVTMRECDLRAANREAIYAGGRFGNAGGSRNASLALWQLQWGGYAPGAAIISSGVATSGSGTGRASAVIRDGGFACRDLLELSAEPATNLFTGLAPGESAPLPDALPADQPFAIDLTDADTGAPIATIDSMTVETVLPTALVLMGLPDTTGYASNPDGVPVGLTAESFTLPPPDPAAASVTLLFAHAVTDAPSVDVEWADGGITLAEEVRYGTARPVNAAMPPGPQTIDVRESGDGQLVGSFTVDVGTGGEVAVLVLQGFLDLSANQGGPPISLDVYNQTPPVLPVELASFTATVDRVGDEPVVVLRWETLSETGNAGFHIQHRDGGEASRRWVDRAFVRGAGTTERRQVYTHRVTGLTPGRHAFRLRQVDVDGTSALGPVEEVTLRPATDVVLTPVAPNPIRDTGTMTLTLRETQRVRITAYDVLGRRVGILHDAPVPAETPTRIAIDSNDLASGTYFLDIRGETFREVQ